MALQIENLKRKFVFDNDGNNVSLADPGEHMSPSEVMKFYSGTYPELTIGSVQGPKIENGEQVFTFITQVGTKG